MKKIAVAGLILSTFTFVGCSRVVGGNDVMFNLGENK